MNHLSLGFREVGKPVVDSSKCTACGYCVRECPNEVWGIENKKAQPGSGKFLGCMACGHCVAVCPENCIVISGRGMLPDDAIDFPSQLKNDRADSLEALLLSRRSTRLFKDIPVERSLVERILRMTAMAPMGIPPSDVGVMVFHGKEKVRELSVATIDTYRKMQRLFRPWLLPLARPFMKKTQYENWKAFLLPLADMLVREFDEGRDLFTYDAPLALIFHHGPYADASDTAIVATYAMLAAESLGLGTCLLGTAVALDFNKAYKKKLEFPAGNNISLGLIVGWPRLSYCRAIRRRLGSVSWA